MRQLVELLFLKRGETKEMRCLDLLKGVGLVGVGISLFMGIANPNVIWGVTGLISASYIVLWIIVNRSS